MLYLAIIFFTPATCRMVKLISVTPSDKPGKKLVAKFQSDTGRTRSTHFGQATADDYTKTHDKDQRERYRTRHAKDLQTADPTRAGHLSYYLLWGDSTSLQTNISKYKKMFSL
jgi:hypothetical protein